MNSDNLDTNVIGCARCQAQESLSFEFSMAFQPIVDIVRKEVFAYEALVRGVNGESAWSILSKVCDENRYQFDQACRVKAIEWAAKLNLKTKLSINFLPNAIYQPERCIRTTLEAAKRFNFPVENIMFEFTEVEKYENANHVRRVVEYYQSLGFLTAIDDFGAGYSGLNLLSDFQTDIVKLDMHLIRNIHRDAKRQKIVRHCVAMLKDLNITPLVEGVENAEELECLRAMGISLVQGYLISKPGFESLPQPNFSAFERSF
ncbi:TPA: EAL domain-containing protein [Vibrio vulnificus]